MTDIKYGIANAYIPLQPIARFQGQATDVELMRKEVKNVKAELVIFKISVKLMLAYCDKSSRDNFALFKDFCFLLCDTNFCRIENVHCIN